VPVQSSELFRPIRPGHVFKGALSPPEVNHFRSGPAGFLPTRSFEPTRFSRVGRCHTPGSRALTCASLF
jgi:hypothetical protein